MEKKMNKILSVILGIVIILLLVVPPFIYVKKKHYDNLNLVLEKEVIEAANKCKNEDKCIDNKVTLEYLIDNKYIDKVYDPITKEAISFESYVDFGNNKFVII